MDSEANTPKLVIEVSGGNVQAIYADLEIEARLVDWDNINAGDPGPDRMCFLDGTSAEKFMRIAYYRDHNP